MSTPQRKGPGRPPSAAPVPPPSAAVPAPVSGDPAAAPPARAREIGGVAGPDPTRFGDWEKNGRCIDF
ncbi:MAG: DUF1674 domain-containing protein [Gammaproteobacteria bacterium]|nr:DUF1674 domain-containing protein [Gammaproteobacteria bacterium]